MSRLDDRPRHRWEQIDSVFQDALDRPAAERDAFLDSACVGDDELREIVAELLAAVRPDDALAADASLFLDPSLLAQVATDLDRDPLRPGARIGPYRLIRELGRGGSGTVFLAERDDGAYEQRIALKVLRRGLDTDDVLARFRAERQILASLRHPGIARLLDGGATPDGRPFIVLEAVDGEPITAYARRRSLNLRERLRLFLAVAEALQYAHRRLVVHRDLKPSNILVEADGTVKLVDFGIAKLLDSDAIPGGLPATRTEVRLLTPEYATPEQVRGEPVTTATDVYQLGLLLYELLAGRHPHPLDGARGTTLERVICESVPPPPSSALPGPGDDGGGAALVTTPGRALRGDLDRIVLKALEKEPERRYDSVQQFAEDIDRFLHGRPVRARPAGIGYHAWKLVQRRPAATAATVAATLATAAFVATLWTYASRLEAERDRARLEAAKFEQVSDFLVQLFELPELQEGRGDTLTARVALDRGADRLLAGDEALEPALRASLLQVLGRAYVGLGMADAARPVLETIVALRDEDDSMDPIAVAEALILLAAVHRERREYDGAGERHAAAVALLDTLPGPPDIRLADALQGLALALRRDPAMRDSAAALVRRAVAIRGRLLGTDATEYAHALGTLSYMTGDADDRVAAIRAYRTAVERLRADPAERRALASTASNLAYLLRRSGYPADAESYFREALQVSREVEGDAHPRSVLAMSHLTQLLSSLGRHDEALALLEERLAIEQRARGPRHWRTAAAAESFGQFHQQTGDPVAALHWFRTAHEILLEAVGPDDPRVATIAASIKALCEEWPCPEAD
jgi:eukaryotic-like serine/threonine-protein kinase